MTKPRDPSGIEYATLKCLGVLGREVEAVTGKSERLIRMYSDPDEGRHIPMKDALALDLAMKERGEVPPHQAAYNQFLEDARSGHAGQCPRQAFMKIAAELSPLANSVTEALTDNVIDLNEEREILTAGQAMIDTIHSLMEVVKAARAAANRPTAITIPINGSIR